MSEYRSPAVSVFRHPAVLVASDSAPVVPSIVSADVVVVDVPATVVVDRYRFPPALRNVHCAKPAPAERESWASVEEDRVKLNALFGVVVAFLGTK